MTELLPLNNQYPNVSLRAVTLPFVSHYHRLFVGGEALLHTLAILFCCGVVPSGFIVIVILSGNALHHKDPDYQFPKWVSLFLPVACFICGIYLSWLYSKLQVTKTIVLMQQEDMAVYKKLQNMCKLFGIVGLCAMLIAASIIWPWQWSNLENGIFRSAVGMVLFLWVFQVCLVTFVGQVSFFILLYYITSYCHRFEATLFSRTITARNIEDQLQFLQVSPTSNADTRSIMALGIAWQKHLLKCARLFSPGLVVGLAVLTLWFLGGVMTLLLDLPRVWINGYVPVVCSSLLAILALQPALHVTMKWEAVWVEPAIWEEWNESERLFLLKFFREVKPIGFPVLGISINLTLVKSIAATAIASFAALAFKRINSSLFENRL